jgi:ribosomal protein L13E
MSDPVQVEAARIPDRDRLLGELREAGLDARPVDELGIEVPVKGRPKT